MHCLATQILAATQHEQAVTSSASTGAHMAVTLSVSAGAHMAKKRKKVIGKLPVEKQNENPGKAGTCAASIGDAGCIDEGPSQRDP